MTLKIRNNVFSKLLLLIVEAPATVAQTSSYSASEWQRGSNTLHSPDSLTDIWPQSSQLKHFKLSSVAEPRRQSDPEGGRPCSLLVCLLTLMWVQALIWWFSLNASSCSLSLWLSVSLTQTQCGPLAPQYSRALHFLQNFTRLKATNSTNTQTKTFG